MEEDGGPRVLGLGGPKGTPQIQTHVTQFLGQGQEVSRLAQPPCTLQVKTLLAPSSAGGETEED